MAWVLEAATGQRFADLVSERVWKPIGAEQSAGITVDVSGFTLASGGMFATLRDTARIGQLIINRGKVGNRQVIPKLWIDDILDQKGDATLPYLSTESIDPYYRSFIWGVGDRQGTVLAAGVHGQFIYVSPSTGIVIAMYSSWPNADGGSPGVGATEALAILEAIRNSI
jgi:CubicO group peptidase (beta-lactamase class C family)